MRDRLRGLRTILAFAFRADASRSIALILISVFEALVRASFVLWLRILTDGVLQRDLTQVASAAGAYGCALFLLSLTNLPRVEMAQRVVEKTTFLLDQHLIELTTAIPTIEHHERPEYQDKLKALERERANLGAIVSALTGTLLIYVHLGGTLALLISIHPILALLPLFALPAALAGAKAVAMRQKALDDTAETTRAAEHVMRLATSAAAGKELRIFHLGETLLERHRALWGRFDREMGSIERRGGLLTISGWALFALAYGGALAFVALRAVADPASTSIGELVMTIAILGQLTERVGGAVTTVRWLGANLKIVGRYLWLVDYAVDAQRRDRGSRTPPSVVSGGIELRSVGFRYPGTDADVLSDIDIHLPAGATVALVGENGAGKTTFVKLLCRMYEPTEGSILLDGTDITEFSVGDWRARSSAAFQDLARFEFLAREAVGVGSLPFIDDDEAVLAALHRASARDLVADLPAALDTQLGKQFTGGAELSAGQWQKVALGRAMMREDPLLLVLDEPTASLDAQTEHALFERFAGAAREVSTRTGGITVLVSHRFSTVRMADLIIVLQNGKVVESGSHAELMARDALYAELYSLQARAYR